MKRSDQLLLSGSVLIAMWKKEYYRKVIVSLNTMVSKQESSPVYFGRAMWINLAVSKVLMCVLLPRRAARFIHLIWMEISHCELFVFFTRNPENKNVFNVNNK
jgi:hypothetical protein